MSNYEDFQGSLNQSTYGRSEGYEARVEEERIRRAQEAQRVAAEEAAAVGDQELPQETVSQDPSGELSLEQAEPQQQAAPQQEAAPQEPSAAEQIESSRDEDREFQRNMIQEAQDWLGEKFGLGTAEERQAEREAGAEQQQAAQAKVQEGVGDVADAAISTVLGDNDVAKAVTSGVEKSVQDTIGFANFAGDFAKTRLGMVDADDEWNNTDLANYKGAERDLILAEPTSTVGLLARDMVSFIGVAQKVKGITGLGKIATGKGVAGITTRMGVEAVVGAVTDFMMDPGDGNASNALQEFFPALKDNQLLSVFGHDSEDTQAMRRLKNTLEGGVMGVALDGSSEVIGALFKGGKFVLDWLRSHPGKTRADVPKEVVEKSTEIFYEQLELGLPKTKIKPEKTLGAHDVFDEVSEGDYSRLNQLNAKELRSLLKDYEIDQFAAPRDILENVDPFVSYEAFGEGIFNKKLPNGTNIEWSLQDVSDQYAAEIGNLSGRMQAHQSLTEQGLEITPETIRAEMGRMGIPETLDSGNSSPLAGRKVNRIDWSLSDVDADAGGLGREATQMFRQFSEVVSDTLKPGDIMVTEAAEDGFGIAGRSAAQERASLNKNSNRNKAAKKWVTENNDKLKEQYLKDIGQTDPEYWDDLPMQAKWDHFDGRQVEGVEPFKVPESEKSVRQKLYERAGFSTPDMDNKMYGVIRKDKKGRARLEPLDIKGDIDEQVAKAIADSHKQLDLELDYSSARPGKEERLANAAETSGTRSRADYEPYETAARTTQYDIEETMRTVDEGRTRVASEPSSPAPYVTDNTLRQINEGGGNAELVEEIVNGMDPDELAKRLNSNDPEIIKGAQAKIAEFMEANADGKVDMSPLLAIVEEGELPTPYIRSLMGQKVVKTLIADVSDQISTTAKTAQQILDTGMDAAPQLDGMLERLKGLARLQIMDGNYAGSKLQSFNKAMGFDPSEAAKKRIKDIDDEVDKIKEGLYNHDPEAVHKATVLAEAMTLADGDADLTQKFWERYMSMSLENFQTTMYNAYLSSPRTHMRNILGSSTNILLKPAQMTMGSLGNLNEARASLSMYPAFIGSLGDSWKAAATTWKAGSVGSNARFASQEDMVKRLAHLRTSAKGPAENAAAILETARYYMLNNALFTSPTRFMAASDAAFRTISARMKAKHDAVALALDDGNAFDPDKFQKVWSMKFKNGEVIDEELLNWAKTDTFQEDLTGVSAKVADLINEVPVMKALVPFIKTPANILAQTAHYTPLLGRLVYKFPIGDVFFKEYTQVMRGTDEAAKAVYRGREGMGIMVGVTAMALGSQGIITGAGPQDPRDARAWRENHQEHSIKIGGNYYSHRVLGPLSTLFSLYADLGHFAANQGSYDTVEQKFKQLAYSTAGALAEQSYVRAISEAMDVVNSYISGEGETDPDKIIPGIARALVPIAGALRDFNNALTPGVRAYNNGWEQLAAETIPGLKEELGVEKISPLSGKSVRGDNMSRANLFHPFTAKEADTSPAANYLVKYGVGVSLEWQRKYKNEYELKPIDQYHINKNMAEIGLEKAITDYFESDFFQAEYAEWAAQDPPTPRESAKWYESATAILQDVKREAVQKYREDATPEAIAFDNIASQIDIREYQAGKGNYSNASDAQAQINELKNF